MKKETLVLIVGFLLILLPSLGVPEEWKRTATISLGVFLMLLGYLLIKVRLQSDSDMGNGERGGDTFVETTKSLFSDK